MKEIEEPNMAILKCCTEAGLSGVRKKIKLNTRQSTDVTCCLAGTHLFGGKHHADLGSRMGVSGCPVCPSTVLMDGLGNRLMPWVATPTMLVLLALLMLAFEPDEEYDEGVKVVESMSFSWDGLSPSQGEPF